MVNSDAIESSKDMRIVRQIKQLKATFSIKSIFGLILIVTVNLDISAEQSFTSAIDVKIVQDEKGINVVASTNIAMTPAAFVDLLNRTNDDCSWIHNCASVVFEDSQISQAESHQKAQKWRTVFASPWPFHDREMVTYSKISIANSGETLIEIEGDDAAQVNDRQNVLITNVSAKWIINPVSDSYSTLTYIGFADPGGAIPRFLINNMLKTASEKTFLNVHKIANSRTLDKQEIENNYANKANKLK
jgi:hypothetical protein